MNAHIFYRLVTQGLVKQAALLLLSGLLATHSFAQIGTLNSVAQPVSPNAAALGKFVEMPVSNYSGLADISIPLYTLQAKGINVPISLAYHSSGIKVRDIPSTVGAGFALSAGGVITRIVKGITDGNDLTHPGVYKAGLETIGWPGGVDFPDYRMMQGVDSEVYYGDNNKVDMEFDVFYYNFMGYSGRFTFNKDGEIVMLDVNGLKPVNGGGFIFTDPDGYIYEFNKEEYTPNSVIPSVKSWYLTSITGPVKHEVVEFKYKTYGYGIYRTDYGKPSRWEKIRYQDESGHYPPTPDQVFNPVCSNAANSGASYDEISNTGGIILDKICFSSDTIKFYHDSSRADIYKIKLDSIKVIQGASVVQRIKFAYTFNNVGGSALDKKMLLSSLTINDQSPYQFSYYDSYLGKTMPGIFAKGEDFWGFYNGEDFPEKANGLEGPPRFRSLIYGQTDNGFNSSHRNPDYRYAQLGSLKTITYPTGGRTELEYEGNDFTEGFTAGLPEDDLSIVLLFDSLRTDGIVASTAPGNYYPSGLTRSKEIMVHHGQTVTVSTSLGLAPVINNQSAYASHIYNGGAGYESTVRLYKYNNGTGVFDLLEERSYNPVTLMGLPADDAAFYAARNSYGTSAENHTLSLTEGRYKVEAVTDPFAYGLTGEIMVTSDFKYRKHISGSGFYRSFIYNAGGIRVKKIKFVSPVNSSSFEKTYSYKDGIKSSGWLLSPFANVTTNMYWGEMRVGGSVCPQLCNFYLFHYDNVIPLGNAQGGTIGYSKVTEQMNDGRKKLMYYSIVPDGYNYNYLGYVPIIDRLVDDNSSYRGLLLYEEQYNGSGQKLRSTSRSYTSGNANVVKNVYANLTDISVSNCNMSMPYFNNFGQGWASYYHTQAKVVPLKETTKYFNGTDSLTEITKNQYTFWDSTYPAKTTRISSSGDSTVTNFKYPYDYSGSAPGDTYAISNYSRNLLHIISQPVETHTVRYTGGVARVTGAELVSFRANVLAPDTVFNLVSAEGLSDFAPLSITGSGAVKDTRYQRRLIFHNFNHGNVVEQSKAGEPKEVLLYGYQHRYIVARVSSSDYATVRALVDTTILNNPSSDAALRNTLNNIRTSLASSNLKAKVTTYTYAPLKGMTSMTDPRGETTFYAYDPYGKLKLRKDADGAIKEKVSYHFKP
jgi:YD repeat-containing protein